MCVHVWQSWLFGKMMIMTVINGDYWTWWFLAANFYPAFLAVLTTWDLFNEIIYFITISAHVRRIPGSRDRFTHINLSNLLTTYTTALSWPCKNLNFHDKGLSGKRCSGLLPKQLGFIFKAISNELKQQIPQFPVSHHLGDSLKMSLCSEKQSEAGQS